MICGLWYTKFLQKFQNLTIYVFFFLVSIQKPLTGKLRNDCWLFNCLALIVITNRSVQILEKGLNYIQRLPTLSLSVNQRHSNNLIQICHKKTNQHFNIYTQEFLSKTKVPAFLNEHVKLKQYTYVTNSGESNFLSFFFSKIHFFLHKAKYDMML